MFHSEGWFSSLELLIQVPEMVPQNSNSRNIFKTANWSVLNSNVVPETLLLVVWKNYTNYSSNTGKLWNFLSPTDSPKSTRINASARTQAPQIGYITIPLHANTSELEELLLPVLQNKFIIIMVSDARFSKSYMARRLKEQIIEKWSKWNSNTKNSKFVCFKNHAVKNQISTKSPCHGSVRLMAPKNGNCPRKVEIRELDIAHWAIN